MKKLIVSVSLFMSSYSFSHEGHMGDVMGHLHGVEGLAVIALVACVVAGLMFKNK